MKILIVEDDETLNQGLCRALRSQERQIVSCKNLSEARTQLSKETLSLALLDINLPDSSGLDLLDENALSVTVNRLRSKLSLGEKIKTVYGIGYMWVKEK